MYHYTDGGLRNVWLANGHEIKNTPYGEGVVALDDMDQRQAKQVLVEMARLLAVAATPGKVMQRTNGNQRFDRLECHGGRLPVQEGCFRKAPSGPEPVLQFKRNNLIN